MFNLENEAEQSLCLLIRQARHRLWHSRQVRLTTNGFHNKAGYAGPESDGYWQGLPLRHSCRQTRNEAIAGAGGVDDAAWGDGRAGRAGPCRLPARACRATGADYC